MLAIVSVIVMFVWSLICALECEGLEAAVVAVIGSFVSIISATIVLPSIIAKYLFNLDEEKVTITDTMASITTPKKIILK